MKYVLVAIPQVLWFLLTPALLLSQPVPEPVAAPVSDIAPVPEPVAAPVSDIAPVAAPVSDIAPVAAPVSDIAPSPMPAPPPGCPSTCGNINIPYPFGIGSNCAGPGFSLTCDDSFNPPRLYGGDFEVIDMALETGEMSVFTPVSYTCYNSSNTTESRGVVGWQFDLTNSPFQISPKKNEFTAIGCNTLAFLQSSYYLAGCITTCVSLDEAAGDDKPCTGLGCCQSTIQSNLSIISVDLSNLVSNDTLLPAWKYSPCSHAFVAEKGWYNFRRKDLNGTGDESYAYRVGERSIPLVLDWAITSNGTCPLWSANPTAPACVSNHSYCTKATERPGYLCNCYEGYSGNPYVIDGCTNINECKKQNHCQSGSTCRDTPGGYECKCKFGQKGDGKSPKGCRPMLPATVVATIATLCAVILLGVLLSFIRREHKRRKQRGFFDKNGGEILKRMNINIFTQAQLDKITGHYNTPIGEGAFGKVFLGTIIDGNQQVAVKFAKGEERLGQDDFVNEITIQFGISHPNLVRLIGCCLETDVPMLVFEFIPNGSLHNVLHVAKKHILSLSERLDIATGSAEALTYMHSHASQKILHGDVKSNNILLDENFKPKVSDFGSSKHELIARYNKWSVMGDMNYIDPTYLKTGDFTEKSDVYSFGVVLLELITQKKPKYDGSNSLVINFVKSYKDESTRREMYDQEILSPAQPHYMECLDRFSEIAVQCLKEDVDDRPTMAQVVEQLKLVKLRAREAEITG